MRFAVLVRTSSSSSRFAESGSTRARTSAAIRQTSLSSVLYPTSSSIRTGSPRGLTRRSTALSRAIESSASSVSSPGISGSRLPFARFLKASAIQCSSTRAKAAATRSGSRAETFTSSTETVTRGSRSMAAVMNLTIIEVVNVFTRRFVSSVWYAVGNSNSPSLTCLTSRSSVRRARLNVRDASLRRSAPMPSRRVEAEVATPNRVRPIREWTVNDRANVSAHRRTGSAGLHGGRKTIIKEKSAAVRLVPPTGLEPVTPALRMRCSTS